MFRNFHLGPTVRNVEGGFFKSKFREGETVCTTLHLVATMASVETIPRLRFRPAVCSHKWVSGKARKGVGGGGNGISVGTEIELLIIIIFKQTGIWRTTSYQLTCFEVLQCFSSLKTNEKTPRIQSTVSCISTRGMTYFGTSIFKPAKLNVHIGSIPKQFWFLSRTPYHQRPNRGAPMPDHTVGDGVQPR